MIDIRHIVVCVLLGSCMANASGEDKMPSDQISFQVDVDRAIDNDQVSVVLKAYDENPDPAKLASLINKVMRWGMEAAKQVEDIKVRTGGYQTYPVYSDKKRIQHWRGQQELLLEAKDVGRLSDLVGRLQARLQVQSMQFSVSPEVRRNTQDALIEEALQSFTKRAKLVSKSLDAAGYEIMNISINTSGHDYPPPVRMESMRTAAQASIDRPVMEAGTSRISVQAAGTIHLQR